MFLKYFITIFFLLIISYNTVMAFDYSKCASAKRSWVPPFNLFLSTSSFITSTGSCAMLGEISHDKKVYFAQNFDNMKVDIATGGGEYLEAYLSLSKCSSDAQKSIVPLLQNQYTAIYGQTSQNDFKTSFWALEKILREAGQGQCIIST